MKSKIYIFAAILVLTAVFLGCNKETYTVTFNPNGGTGTMSAQTFTEGEAQALMRNTFTYDGYTFTGWNSVAGGSGASYTDGQTINAVSDMTLYAQWTSNGSSGGGQHGGESPTPPSPEGSPTVKTLAAELESINSLKLSGDVTAAGNAPVIARGFMYGTSADNFSSSVECGAGTGSFTKTITGLELFDATFYYKAYATNSIGTAYGEIKSFTISTTATGSLNGHEFIDLGLPSGLLWATCNVGATTPEGNGDYFAWGETTTKDIYNWSTYKYCNSRIKLTKYCNNSSYGNNGFADTLITLEASDDAVTANWGDGWRMPTRYEMNELYNNCVLIWTTQNGVGGDKIIGPNGNTIFLPAAGGRLDGSFISVGSYGSYWSSSLSTDDPYGAWYLDFRSDGCGQDDNYGRDLGLSIRAVCLSQN